MIVQSADEVWSRIQALASVHGGGVVATDGDGTLWSGDVGEDLFHAFVEHGDAEPASLQAMKRVAREHALSDAGSGSDVARRIYDDYVEGRFPEERVCELMAWCFAGWTRDRLQAFARDVVERGRLETRLHHEVVRLLERVRGAGIETFLVSASPLAVVVEAGARVGFAPDHVVAAQAPFEGEVMLAEAERPIPYGPGKIVRLLERIGAPRMVYAALGDNGFDVALLLGARIGVAVRPKPRLRERAHEIPDAVELAPEHC